MKRDLRDLKHSLLAKTYIHLPIAFIPSDDNSLYVMNEYIDKICSNYNKERINIKSLDTIADYESDMFSENNNIYIFEVPDNFTDYSTVPDNTIIVAKKYIDNDVDSYLIDKLKPSYIEEYIKTIIPGLSADRVKYLCEISNYDLNRLYNEAVKINIFEKDLHNNLFDSISETGGYSDLTSMNIFDFVDGIVKKDMLKLHKVYDKIKYIDIEATGVVTLLLKQFKNMIDVHLTGGNSSGNSNMSPKQIAFIKYNLNKYSKKELVSTYDFLTAFDYKLKNGELDLANDELYTYIMSTILNRGL